MRTATLILAATLMSGCAHFDPGTHGKPPPRNPEGPRVGQVLDCAVDQCVPIDVRNSRVLNATVLVHKGSCLYTSYNDDIKVQLRLPDGHPLCNDT